MADDMLSKRLHELSDRSDRTCSYVYTNFLSLGEISEFHTIEKSLCPAELFGGMDGCERMVVRFGNADMTGFEESFPIACLKIEPLSMKFSEELTHRDVLGAIMSLGIEREMIGDIVIDGHCAYVFCMEQMASYLQDSLTSIRHTSIACTISNAVPDGIIDQGMSYKLPAASERCDIIIAKLLHLSRERTKELFQQEKVFINSMVTDSPAKELKEGDSVTVRGFGKFIFEGTDGKSKRGKDYILLRLYGIKP